MCRCTKTRAEYTGIPIIALSITRFQCDNLPFKSSWSPPKDRAPPRGATWSSRRTRPRLRPNRSRRVPAGTTGAFRNGPRCCLRSNRRSTSPLSPSKKAAAQNQIAAPEKRPPALECFIIATLLCQSRDPDTPGRWGEYGYGTATRPSACANTHIAFTRSARRPRNATPCLPPDAAKP